MCPDQNSGQRGGQEQRRVYQSELWVQNYFFVDLPATDPNYIARGSRHDAAHCCSGKLHVRLRTVDPLFIGSGFQELEGGSFVRQPLIEGDSAVIPASGLKGAVRQICRAVSASCVPNETYSVPVFREGKRKWDEHHITLPEHSRSACRGDLACIVCDMFGRMGWSGKVFFGDLTAEHPGTARYKAAQQYSPHPEDPAYRGENGAHRYKFYRTVIPVISGRQQFELLRAVQPGTVFTGEITYRGLDARELALLMYGLGQSRTISLKLGGYRNEGFGTVNLELSGEELDPEALAAEHRKNAGAAAEAGIAQLEAGMTYKTVLEDRKERGRA